MEERAQHVIVLETDGDTLLLVFADEAVMGEWQAAITASVMAN